MNLDSDLKLILSDLNAYKDLLPKLKDDLQINIKILKNHKANFFNKYNSIINELENISKTISIVENENEESPASHVSVFSPSFKNGSKHLSINGRNSYTCCCEEVLPLQFEIEIKIICTGTNSTAIGFSKSFIEENISLFDSKNDCWGYACNKNVKTLGSWQSKGLGYKTGDSLKIRRDGYNFSFAVNDIWDENVFQIEAEDLYLAVCFAASEGEIEIL